MTKHFKILCERYGLVYTEAGELGLRRRRCGRGFAYVDSKGKAVKDRRTKEAIRQLAIPPAWTEVAIAENRDAHLQAVGRDAAGRLQYRYHPRWEEARADVKRQHLLRFGQALPRIRRKVAELLRQPGLSRAKLTAAIVRLMDRALLRPGHEEYARQGGGRGAATLLSSDVSINGDEITVCFIGKGGKQLERTVSDPLLAGILGDLIKRRGRKRLFALPKKNRPISAREVNEFLSSVGGAEISAKDFRTFRASAAALTSLLEHEGGESATAQRRAIQDIADRVSEELGNTRAVARSSYIHPEVIEAYENEALRPALLNGPPKRGLKRMEQALLRFLGSRRRPAPQPVPDEQRSS